MTFVSRRFGLSSGLRALTSEGSSLYSLRSTDHHVSSVYWLGAGRGSDNQAEIVKSKTLNLKVSGIPQAGRRYTTGLSKAELEAMLSADQLPFRVADEGMGVDLEVNRRGANVFVAGTIATRIHYDCGRCSQEREVAIEIRIDWTYLSEERYRAALREGEELELKVDDIDVSFYSGDEIDLLEIVREAFYLELPPYPACPEGCEGVDISSLSKAQPENSQALDPRWAPLLELKKKNHLT